MLARLECIVFVIVVTLLLQGGVARGAALIRRSIFEDSLVPAYSSATTELGTRITLRNLQRYKGFLPYGIQVQYSGRYFWHVGSDPSFTITVGPTQSVKLPKQFRQDTEKYGGQAKLERVDSGGFTMTGYTPAFVSQPRRTREGHQDPVQRAVSSHARRFAVRFRRLPGR
jgi:hypothetical protein